MIVHKDCNLEKAIESCLFGTTGTAGQRCTSTRTLFVHEDIYADFEAKLIEGYKTRVHIGANSYFECIILLYRGSSFVLFLNVN